MTTTVEPQLFHAEQPRDYEPRYSIAQVSAATGIPPGTIKNWLTREPQVILKTAEEKEKVGRGRPFLFSFQRAVQVALVAKLVSMGMDPRRAASAAVGFTDIGESYSPGDDLSLVRMPGELFKKGATVLVVHSASEMGHVINMDVYSTPMSQLFTHHGRHEEAVAVLVNPLVDRLRAALQ
jgi:hypothetical protein